MVRIFNNLLSYSDHFCWYCNNPLGSFSTNSSSHQVTCNRCNRDNLIDGTYTSPGDDYSPWLDTFDDIAILDTLTPYARKDIIAKELAYHKNLEVSYKEIDIYINYNSKIIYMFNESDKDYCYYHILTAWNARDKEKEYRIYKSLINVLKKMDYTALKKKHFLSQI